MLSLRATTIKADIKFTGSGRNQKQNSWFPQRREIILQQGYTHFTRTIQRAACSHPGPGNENLEASKNYWQNHDTQILHNHETKTESTFVQQNRKRTIPMSVYVDEPNTNKRRSYDWREHKIWSANNKWQPTNHHRAHNKNHHKLYLQNILSSTRWRSNILPPVISIK